MNGCRGGVYYYISARVMYCVVERSLGKPMSTWIFQSNPNKFDIDGYLAASADHRIIVNFSDEVY